MNRAEAITQILEVFATEPIVVTLGTTSREVIAQSPEAANHLHLLDSMGLAPSVAAGIALGLPSRHTGKVVALEGDGGLVMGFSILATLSHLELTNLVLIILDDGVYAATGGQSSGTATVDICAVARACGLEAEETRDRSELASSLSRAKGATRACLLRVRIDQVMVKQPLYLPDPPTLTDRFRRLLASLR
jgi:sulfopyruvate decarboxylase subunit beta